MSFIHTWRCRTTEKRKYVCMCVDLCVGLCVCIFLRSPKVVVTDTCFWSFLPHLWAPMGDPFTPPEPLLTKRSSMLATVMIFIERKRLVAIETLHSHPWSCCFSHVCFGPFLPYLYMVMGDPTTQPQLLTTNVLSLGPTTMIFMKKKPRQIHYKSITPGI